MAKHYNLKGLRKFGKFRVLLVAVGLVVAGLAVAFIYADTTCTTSNGSTTCTTTQTGSSNSGDCSVTGSNQSCSTQDVSGGNTNTCFNDNCSTSTGTKTTTNTTAQPASGGLACTVLSTDTIRWKASWQDAPGVVVLAHNANNAHRFKGTGAPATGTATWDESGLNPATAYRGELRHNYNGASTIISTRTCRTSGEPTNNNKTTTNSSSSSNSVNGQVVVCNNNLCTTYSSGGTTSSSNSTVTTQVCQNGVCKTYTSQSSSSGVGQSLTCVNGNCQYEAHDAVPTSGVKGFFVNLYLSIHGLLSHLF